MIKILFLLPIFLLVSLVNGHANLQDPPSRAMLQRREYSADFSGGLQFQYYYRGGDHHVCGNNGWDNWSVDTQLTGPIQRTYISGTQVNMTAKIFNPHGGFFTVKLCKLNKPSDIVSQECFDNEILKITSISGLNTTLIDDYHAGMIFDNQQTFYVNFTVQLPVGLTCDNCVILYDWPQPALKCKYANGSNVKFDYLNPNADLARCAEQHFKSCSDIKILPNPDQTSKVYVPNPVKPIPDSSDKFFQCFQANNEYGNHPVMDPLLFPNKRPDLNQFTGAGLFCIYADDQSICDSCRQNCMDPSKKCPKECYCRWYPKKVNVYQTPIAPNAWSTLP